ncbi:respiratory nitrate reductase 1 subunit alpha [Salmonella enterica subsp. enterica]|nr:respiratory nitrate reductase 1 subunit alpha [Salmonella enterica subsp. enterica]
MKPEEVEWRDNGLDGKLDLVVTLDFRLSSTCLYSDIVLPTATWYEKDDMNTSDMHPFIHPLSAAGRSGLGIEKRLGNLQRHCEEILRSLCRSLG